MAIKTKQEQRQRRHLRVRTKVSGTADIPRLNFYKSNQNIYAQIINDETGTTIVSASSLKSKTPANIATAAMVGTEVAKLAKAKKITKVVFDRGGFLYHGKVKAFADAARAEGLDF